MTRILFPFDGSAPAQHALEWLLRWAQIPVPLHVRVLNVQAYAFVPPEPMTADLFAACEAAMLAAGRRLVAPVAERLAAAGVPHDVDVVIGSPAEAIAKQACDHQCDQVVMGTRGLGAVKGLMVGSTATKVVHLTPIPVTLVK